VKDQTRCIEKPYFGFIDTTPRISLTTPEQRNCIDKSIQIIVINRHILPIDRDHIMRPHSILIIHRDRLTIAFHTEDAILAYLTIALVRTASAVVVEEAVQPSAINVDDAAVDNAETPAIGSGDGEAVCGDGGLSEARIEVFGSVGEGDFGVGVGLVVCCFCLDL
jgi:hypothetical protein